MIDDGRVLGKSSEETMRDLKIVLDTFMRSGWNIQWAKTSDEVTRQLYHQGFVTNTVLMKYELPDFKIKHLEKQIEELKPTIKLLGFSRIIGKLMSAARAIGPMMNVMLRSSHQLLASAVCAEGDDAWDKYFPISNNIREDLSFIYFNMRVYNGQPIINGRSNGSLY